MIVAMFALTMASGLARAADTAPATAPVPAVVPASPAVPADQAATAIAPASTAPNAQAPAVAADAQPAADAAKSPKPPYPLLFLWPEESAAIDQAISERDHPPATEVRAKAQAQEEAAAAAYNSGPHLPNVYVSAILDFGDGDWTVWANGLRVTPAQQSPLFHIVAVRGNAVDIVVPGAEGGRFVLQPFQTWRSRQKDVVEGIFP